MLKCALACATVGLTVGLELDVSSTSTTDEPRECEDRGVIPKQNSDENVGYVIGWYGEGSPMDTPQVADNGIANSILWPFPLDHCQALGPWAGLPKGTFTCDNEDQFTFTKYAPNDKMCSDTPVEVSTYNSSDLSAPYSFNCAEDRTEAYSEFWAVIADTTCNHDKVSMIAVNVCFGMLFPPKMKDPGVATWYCDAEGAQLNIFELDDGDLCADEELCDLSVLRTDECDVMYSIKSLSIYAKPVACHSVDVEDEDNDCKTLSAMFAMLVATLFVAMFV